MARTSAKSKIVKSIPTSEIRKVTYLNGKYITTHNPLKEQFTLWKCVEEGYEKIDTSKNPLDFDKIIPW